MARILLIEDEPALRASLEDNLRFDGHEVVSSGRGDEGLSLALGQRFELVLLDVMLPGLDGFAVCRRLKEESPGLPVLLISARDQAVDVVRGLELGADDYIKKPFEMVEVLARIRARLRPTVVERSEFLLGDWSLDVRKMELSKEGFCLTLTARECRILEYFAQRKGEVISREELLEHVWGYDSFPTTRTVDNYILRLRKLIEEEPNHPRLLISVRGAGYRLSDE